MVPDEIVEEVRRARARLLERAGGDLDRLAALLQRAEAEEPRGTVDLPPRPPESTDGERAA